MITKFDKNGAVALNKRRFAECLEDGDYEGALDCLIKYSQAAENPQFHIACGMLYLLMTQDSDDTELLALAFREFMLYIRKHPDCSAAFRNLLAVVFLRREPLSMVDVGVFAKACGHDPDKLLEKLGEVGIGMFIGEDEFVGDLEDLFEAGEFGVIDPAYRIRSDTEEVPVNNSSAARTDGTKNRGSKIIDFKGKKISDSQPVGEDENRIIKIYDEKPAADENVDVEQVMEIFARIAGDDGKEDGDSLFDVAQFDGVDGKELRARLCLREAERLVKEGDIDGALAALGKIGADSGRMYYCAECLRAYIFMDVGNIASARAALDRAAERNGKGALVGTLLCRLYEITDETEKIPYALSNIDVTDFIDADHVYKAARYAIKYCEPDDALDLMEDYIDEFNVMDIRLLYAQMLYNNGEKELAVEELYKLTRIFYDDFNVWYYYLAAKSGINELPIDEEAPQGALSALIDGIMDIVSSDRLSDEIINGDAFGYGLETFLSLEFENVRGVVGIMFEVLRKLAKDRRLVEKMRDTLVSPYAEPIVKAAILAELLCGGDTEYTLEVVYCPLNSIMFPPPGPEYSDGYRIAFAYAVTLCKWTVADFWELCERVKPILDGSGADERDKAYYLIRTLRKRGKNAKNLADGRIDYALGYSTKTEANRAYKQLDSFMTERLKTETE